MPMGSKVEGAKWTGRDKPEGARWTGRDKPMPIPGRSKKKAAVLEALRRRMESDPSMQRSKMSPKGY